MNYTEYLKQEDPQKLNSWKVKIEQLDVYRIFNLWWLIYVELNCNNCVYITDKEHEGIFFTKDLDWNFKSPSVFKLWEVLYNKYLLDE